MVFRGRWRQIPKIGDVSFGWSHEHRSLTIFCLFRFFFPSEFLEAYTFSCQDRRGEPLTGWMEHRDNVVHSIDVPLHLGVRLHTPKELDGWSSPSWAISWVQDSIIGGLSNFWHHHLSYTRSSYAIHFVGVALGVQSLFSSLRCWHVASIRGCTGKKQIVRYLKCSGMWQSWRKVPSTLPYAVKGTQALQSVTQAWPKLTLVDWDDVVFHSLTSLLYLVCSSLHFYPAESSRYSGSWRLQSMIPVLAELHITWGHMYEHVLYPQHPIDWWWPEEYYLSHSEKNQ